MKRIILILITFLSSVSALYAGVLSADKTRGEWTLMVIPDTQGYAEDWSEEGYNYWKMERTFEWILSISDALNIKVVQSVGDMIESHNDTEWQRADKVEWYTYSAIANDGKGAFWTEDPDSEGSFELVQEDPAVVVEKDEHSSGSGNSVLRRVTIQTKQGVAVDEKYFYAISNTIIIKCDKETGKVIATWQANKKGKAYEHFFHLNSGTVVEGRLYCAHSRYGIDPNDCTVEIWNVENQGLTHEGTIRMPRNHGSLTWIDRHVDHSWWMCYAVYGKNKNKHTKLVKYQYRDKNFIEVKSWFFPEEVVANWGDMSCSGGSWGPDGYLYTTGHDHSRAYVLEVNKTNTGCWLFRTGYSMGSILEKSSALGYKQKQGHFSYIDS